MIHFGVIGTQHNHVIGLTDLLIGAGAQPTSFYEPDTRFAALFAQRFPHIPAAPFSSAIFEDPAVALIVIASEPAQRAAIAVEAMRHGKDVVLDKPAVVSREGLAELRAAQRETGRIMSVFFSEHFSDRVTLKALELVRSGAIGDVVHITSLSPHKIGVALRPEWFYQAEQYAGVINDLLVHHVHQFMAFTGSDQITVEHARAGNRAHPQFPDFEDSGDLLLSAPHATGYARADWFTPDGLPTWGDVRMFITGSTGSLELRKTIDVGVGSEGKLYQVDHAGIHAIDCADVPITYGEQLLRDVAERTETIMTQEHCFRVCEVTLDAYALAKQTRPLQRGSASAMISP